MTAFKCDFCGALYQRPNAIVLVKGCRNSYNTPAKDICDVCYDAVIKTLNERAILEQKKENNHD